MKNNRGITMSSLIIYVMTMTMVVGIVSYVSRYFYKNVSEASGNAKTVSAYTTFNSYFTEEINLSGNYVVECDDDGNQKYIVFSKSGNQFTFKNGNIYLNQINICRNIEDCTFETMDDETIKVEIQLNGTKFETIYTIKKW